jgi:hypothetical protein
MFRYSPYNLLNTMTERMRFVTVIQKLSSADHIHHDLLHRVTYHVFKKSGRILDRGTTEMDPYAIELFER